MTVRGELVLSRDVPAGAVACAGVSGGLSPRTLTRSWSAALAVLLTVSTAASALGSGAQEPTVRFATSPDGTRIAYDVTGSGPALLLLHGGGQTRRVWHERGYVGRLRSRFTVIAIDLRGHGESDRPTTARAYTIPRLRDDVLAVADAAGARQFGLWGFSYGARASSSLGFAYRRTAR